MILKDQKIYASIVLKKTGKEVQEIGSLLNVSEKDVEKWLNLEIVINAKNVISVLQYLSKMGLLDEIISICALPEFIAEESIQFYRVKALTKLNRYAAARAICRNQAFTNSSLIQSQHVKLLVRNGKKNDARAICKRPEFKNDHAIQFQYITLLLNTGDLDEALKICELEEFRNSSLIQSQHIDILLKKAETEKSESAKIIIEEALEICLNPEFKNSSDIQLRHVHILTMLGRFHEALVICHKPEFAKSSLIQKQSRKILENHVKEDSENSMLEPETNVVIKSQYVNELLKINNDDFNKISDLLWDIIYKKITVEELANSDLAEWQIVVLITALYDIENYNKNMVLRYIASKIAEFLEPEIKGILGLLFNHIYKKDKTFDKYFYLNLLLSKNRTNRLDDEDPDGAEDFNISPKL